MTAVRTSLIRMVMSTTSSFGKSRIPTGGEFSPELEDGYDDKYARYVVKDGDVGRDNFRYSYG